MKKHRNLSLTFLICTLCLLLLCACSSEPQSNTAPPQVPQTSETDIPAPTPDNTSVETEEDTALISGSYDDIWIAELNYENYEKTYSLSPSELANVIELSTQADTALEYSEQTSAPKYVLTFVYSNLEEDVIYSTETGEYFFRYVDFDLAQMNRLHLASHNPALGNYLATLCETVFEKEPETSLLAEDESEYVLSNGLEIGLSYEETIALAGPPAMQDKQENEVAVFYKLFYKHLGVLTLYGQPGDPIEKTSLLCIQLLNYGAETARGLAVGDTATDAYEAYGLRKSNDCALFKLHYPNTYHHGDISAYDGAFAVDNGKAGLEEGRLIFFLFSGDALSSIIIRPAVSLDCFPPVYPPLITSSTTLYSNELMGETLSGIMDISQLHWFQSGEERLYETECRFSQEQISQFTRVLSQAEISNSSTPPEETSDTNGHNFVLTISYSDGTSLTLYSADGGKVIYTESEDGFIIARSNELEDFLRSHYVWTKKDLSFMEW